MKGLPEHSRVALGLQLHRQPMGKLYLRQLLSYLKYRELDQRGILKRKEKKSRKQSILKNVIRILFPEGTVLHLEHPQSLHSPMLWCWPH